MSSNRKQASTKSVKSPYTRDRGIGESKKTANQNRAGSPVGEARSNAAYGEKSGSVAGLSKYQSTSGMPPNTSRANNPSKSEHPNKGRDTL